MCSQNAVNKKFPHRKILEKERGVVLIKEKLVCIEGSEYVCLDGGYQPEKGNFF